MEQVPLWVSLTQIGASILLALAALVVASLSAFWSYRNNFGWLPGIFVVENGFGAEKPIPTTRTPSSSLSFGIGDATR